MGRRDKKPKAVLEEDSASESDSSGKTSTSSSGSDYSENNKSEDRGGLDSTILSAVGDFQVPSDVED